MGNLKKNLISNFLLTSSTILFPLITFPYVARTLSGINYGNVSFIDAFTQYFVLLSAIGIPTYGIREISKVKDKPEQYSKLVSELMTIQLGLSVCYCLLFWGLHFFVPQLKDHLWLILIGCLTVLASSFLVEWFYQGIENFAYITKRALIMKVCSVVCILLLVTQKDDYIIYSLITTLVIVANAGINYYNYRKKFYHRYTGTLELKKHIKPLLVLFSINISISLYTILDTIILGFLTDPLNVSYYNVPLRLTKIYWRVVGSVGVVLIPKIATYFVSNDTKAITSLLQKSVSLVFLMTIPFSMFCFFFPEEILFIIAGDQYMNAVNSLRILSVVPLVIGLCNVFGTQYLLPIGEEKKILHATIVGLILSLSLNFLLIPHFKFLGSAIACLVSESAVCLYIFLAARKHIKLQPDYSLLMQIAISTAACMLARIALSGHLQHIWLLVACMAVYVATFAILQFFVIKNPFIYSLVKFKKGMI
jgi:O-antigen/teichoic acid export membrane protein